MIREPQESDIEELSMLFDAYRQFYGQASDIVQCTLFIKERLNKKDSKIFVAASSQGLVGFVQLYPSFSSVSMKRILILNDLFVLNAARKAGFGNALVEKAERYAANIGAVRLSLATAVDNAPAQSLYECRGWINDADFLHYNYIIKA